MNEHRTPFAALDAQAAHARAALIDYLDGTAADPEIGRVRAEALRLLDPRPGERLLDAGCGAGEVARRLGAAVGPAGAVVALDLSRDVIAVAAGRADRGPVSYVVGDVTALDFPTGHFDAVRAERVLQHLQRPQRAVGELARVTRPGGRVCLVDTDWASLLFDGLPGALVAQVRDATARAGFPVGDRTGRRLRAWLLGADLVDVRARPVTLSFTTPAAAARVVPVLRPPEDPVDGMGAVGDVLAAFRSAAAAAAAADRFLAALTLWVAVGRVPRA